MKYRFNYFLLFIAMIVLSNNLRAQQAAEKSDFVIPGSGTMTVAVNNDHVFRGVSLNDEAPSALISMTYSHPSGVYAGLWSSNLDFGPSFLELKNKSFIFTGLGGETLWDVRWALGYYYVFFPGANGAFDFHEIAMTLTRTFALGSTTVGYFYTPDDFARVGKGHYVSIDWKMPIKHANSDKYPLFLNTHGGFKGIDDNHPEGGSDYYDWSVGLSISIRDALISLDYVDTDIVDNDLTDPRVVFRVSLDFNLF